MTTGASSVENLVMAHTSVGSVNQRTSIQTRSLSTVTTLVSLLHLDPTKIKGNKLWHALNLINYFEQFNLSGQLKEEPQYYENFDLETVVTPVNVRKLVDLLRDSSYNEEEIQFLEDGFTNGFDIGYEGLEMQQSTSENIPLTVGSKVELWNKVMKEVKLK